MAEIRAREIYLFRVSCGTNFKESSIFCTWGVDSRYKSFLKNARSGDLLVFIASNSNGLIIAMATLDHICKRDLGPLINFTKTNEELGWNIPAISMSVELPMKWDMEIHYRDLYNVEKFGLLTYFKAMVSVANYKKCSTCVLDLENEYRYITRYLVPSNNMFDD